ncbi:hypothetical protein ACP4OV_025617 [Aristida adscensionis]
MLVAAAKIIAAALVVLLQLSGSPAAAAPAMAEHCRKARCGEVEVPYPFGITPNCSYPWPGFNLTCDRTRRAPRLFLGDGDGDGTIRVINIDPRSSTMLVHSTGAVHISGGSGKWPAGGGFRDDGPFVLSPQDNELVVAGSNVLATLRDTNGTIITGCSSFSSDLEAYQRGSKFCTGIGCCETFIPKGLVSFDVRSQRIVGNNSLQQMQEPAYVFVAKEDWYNNPVRNAIVPLSDNSSQRNAKNMAVPVVLAWAFRPLMGLPPPPDGRDPFQDCPGHVSSKICKSDHSECDVSQFQEPAGYTCVCKDGYDGNPYIPGGCRDIDECKLVNLQDPKCFGECINTIGSFKCRCREGTSGNHSLPGGCIRIPTISKGASIGMGVGSAAGIIMMVLIAIYMYKKIKRRREIKLKQKFFKQNRGQLLEQLVSQSADIAERMIIPVTELAKATNNFDKTRELGGGGHGTVYKGILSNLRVVAIKKSKITVQKEIDEFINEVAILSQVNHRNVVKLFGCCLETEVPLLVYEFISNGTLYHHLHIEGLRSLPWVARLRIATETSSALAYLHSSVLTPVIHRDIKSSNILLDDTLTSKVSDFGASRYIPIDKTGLTTRVQGTIGYLDPMYFYTGRLTEKSDVYSFGVILLELLTRKKPFSYLSSDGDGLVSHFANLLDEENVGQILDPQVVEEGGKEVQEVIVLAASCTKLTSEDRPTMQQVEHILKGLEVSKKFSRDNMIAEEIEESGIVATNNSWPIGGGQRIKESSRIYSMEQEFLLSARYPR